MAPTNAKFKRISLLKLIRDNRDTLFGRFSSTLPHEIKENKWKEGVATAHALGLVSLDRDWKFVRDTTWMNWRKRTMVRSVIF